jgi:uncharacterized protein (DUF952 family)
MSTIVHIAEAAQWQRARESGSYRGDTLETEGFIHCSRPQQVVPVANAFYRGRADLVLLVIDLEQVQAEVRYEAAPEGELFPHVYGPLNADAVRAVLPFAPRADGTFALPLELEGG